MALQEILVFAAHARTLVIRPICSATSSLHWQSSVFVCAAACMHSRQLPTYATMCASQTMPGSCQRSADTKQILPYLSQLCIQERFCTRCCMLMQPGCDLIGKIISEKTASLQQQHSSKTPPGVSRKLPDFSALLQSPPMACTSHDHVTVCFLSFTKQLKACVTLV